MFCEFSTYCWHCVSIVVLDDDGRCPDCGIVCEPYPLLVDAGAQYRDAYAEHVGLHDISVGMQLFRGELEYGTNWRDLIYFIAGSIFPGDRMKSAIPQMMPKLDVVALSLKDMQRNRIVLHDAHFSDPLYSLAGGVPYAWQGLTGSQLLAPVFPETPETGDRPLRFFDLLPVLAPLLVWNRLWYACLASEFYPVPSDIDVIAAPYHDLRVAYEDLHLPEGAQTDLGQTDRPKILPFRPRKPE